VEKNGPSNSTSANYPIAVSLLTLKTKDTNATRRNIV
jgi:hypothetical protein